MASEAGAQATRWWDLNGTTAGAGGATPSGTWDSTTANWNTVAAGTNATTTWTNNDNARFSAGTDAIGSFDVTVDGTVNVNQIGIEEGNVTFTGGEIYFGANAIGGATSLLTGISGGSANTTITIKSEINGTLGFRIARAAINGNQVVILGNPDNSLTGGIYINSSQTVRLGTSDVIPDPNLVTFSTSAGIVATLDLNGHDETVKSLAHIGGSLAPQVLLGSGTLTLANAIGETFDGIISGTGGLSLTGGFMTLTGSSTYSGTTTVSGAYLAGNAITDQGVDSPFGHGNFVIDNAGTLSYGGPTASTNRAFHLGDDGGRVEVTSGDLTLTGVLSGTGMFRKYGAFDITLTNSNNSYSGPTDIEAGTLRGNSIADGGVNSSFGKGEHFLLRDNGRLFYFGPSASTDRAFIIGGGFAPGTSMIGVDTSSELTLTGPVIGSGNLGVYGGGILTLAGSGGGYDGMTEIHDSTLRLGSDNQIPDGSGLHFFSDLGIPTLDLNDFYETIGSLNQVAPPEESGAVTLGFGVLTITGAGEFSGVISGPGRVVKTGTGAQILTGHNTYTDGTEITGGALVVEGEILGPVFVSGSGTLSGSGNVGDTSNGGRVAPGSSVGTMYINGDYTQTADGVLEIEVGGTLQGEHDQLLITGKATLAGRLEVPIVNNFIPQVDQEIVFLDAAELEGNFKALVSPNLASVAPDIAMIEIASVANSNARIRFLPVSDDITFVTTSDEADWGTEGTFSDPDGPTNVNRVKIENLAEVPQLVKVTTAVEPIHHLTIEGNEAKESVTLRIQDEQSLTATTDVLVNSFAVVQLGRPDVVTDTGILNAGNVSINGGELGGNGIIAAELSIVEGTLSPGFSVGHLTVEGDYRQGAAGVLRVDVEGASRDEFDTVDVSGAAELGGVAVIDAGLLATKEPGITIEILSAQGGLGGTRFDDVVTEGAEGIYFVPSYSADSFQITSALEGDMNPSVPGLDVSDIDAFALGLMNPTRFRQQFGLSPGQACTCNGDGIFDFSDIQRFVQIMEDGGVINPQAALERALLRVPEPSASIYLLIVGVFTIARRKLRTQCLL